MDISGLVYNDHSVSSSPATTRGGVMAPQMATMEGQGYVPDHMANQMGTFNPYGGGQYGFDSQVQQYQVVGHSPAGYGPAAGFPPQQQSHPHHNPHNPHQQPLQQPQQGLPPHRIPPQSIPRDTGQLGRTPANLRMSIQKPTVPTQPPAYTYHPAPQQAQLSPQQRAHHHALQQPSGPQQQKPLPQQGLMQQNQPHQRQPHPQSVSGPPQQQQQQKQPQPPQLQQQQLQQQQLQHQQLQHQQLQQQQLQQQQQRQQQQQALQQPQQTHQGQRQEPSPEQILEKPPRKPDSIAHLVGTTKVRSPNREVDFKTDVDNLMKAIQAKQPRKDDKPPSPSYPAHHTPTNAQDRSGFAAPYHNGWPQQHPQQLGSTPENHHQTSPTMGVNRMLTTREAGGPIEGKKEVHKKPPKQKKRYECMLPGCGKSFFQKTHLDIHSRAHTGDKPFECSEPGCGQRFSQLGNLKTHERRHTGEKPYSCDYCGKRFAQRGNVRAHKIVHDGAKPFTCKLDNCLKQFTQLGNLKSHQNKFHSAALRQLTGKFANIRDTDEITAADRELFEYFAELYKNSNRGIKGRGKDRKISGVKKQPAVDTDVKQDMSMTSPNGSSASNGDHSYDFSSNGTHMDEDEDGSVGSPYEHQQQQLPPLRPGNDMGPAAMGMMTFGHGGEDPMNVHTHMAKYSLDRKFPL